MKPCSLGTSQPKKGTDVATAELLHDVLHKALKEQKKSRKQIAAELAAMVGTKVSVHNLNGFAAPSKGYRHLPAAWVPALCEITGDDRLQRLLLGEPLCSLLELGESALKAIQKSRAVEVATAGVRQRMKGSR